MIGVASSEQKREQHGTNELFDRQINFKNTQAVDPPMWSRAAEPELTRSSPQGARAYKGVAPKFPSTAAHDN